MRNTLLIAIVVLGFTACSKNKFTTAPQITFKSLKPNRLSGNIPITGQNLPVLTFTVTDLEGDLGAKAGVDTAYIYIRNLLVNKSDSFRFPDLTNASMKDFQADVDVTLNTNNLLQASNRPAPKTDTLFFEVYVKDFAKNKSNTIVTNTPLYFVFQ